MTQKRTMKVFKAVHIYPDITPEENEERQKDIVRQLYNIFSNDKKTLDTKVKQ